jgi:soluble lytic murein transglycosylase-like protein
MRRLTTVTLLTLGLIMTTTTADARPRPRRIYCHYQSSDGQPGWSAIDVKHEIQCASSHFGVETSTVLAIARRESGLQAWARNQRSGACGILQHLPRYWPGRRVEFLARHPFWSLRESCFNARSNVLVGVDMMARYGFGPWS